MIASAWILLVVVSAACEFSNGSLTAENSSFSQNGTNLQSQPGLQRCGVLEVDLRTVTSLEFSILQTQCRNSGYCGNLAAEVTSASCWNQNDYPMDPDWRCTAIFAGSGFNVGSEYSVECPGYSWFTPCVSTSSCKFLYTPGFVSQPVAVYGGVGGTVSFIVFWCLVYWCCCRRKRSPAPAPAPVIIRTVETRPAREPTPKPAPAEVSAAQTNVTVNFGPPPTMFPAQHQVAPTYVVPSHPPHCYAAPGYPGAAPPPAYPGPAPAYPGTAPAYAPPSSPPFNPNYAAPQPPKQGHY